MDEILDFLSDFWWVALLLVVLALCVWGIYADQKSWESYAQDHHCQKVGTKDGGFAVGVGSDGKAVTVINPDQTIYKCDNGEIAIR